MVNLVTVPGFQITPSAIENRLTPPVSREDHAESLRYRVVLSFFVSIRLPFKRYDFDGPMLRGYIDNQFRPLFEGLHIRRQHKVTRNRFVIKQNLPIFLLEIEKDFDFNFVGRFDDCLHLIRSVKIDFDRWVGMFMMEAQKIENSRLGFALDGFITVENMSHLKYLVRASKSKPQQPRKKTKAKRKALRKTIGKTEQVIVPIPTPQREAEVKRRSFLRRAADTIAKGLKKLTDLFRKKR